MSIKSKMKTSVDDQVRNFIKRGQKAHNDSFGITKDPDLLIAICKESKKDVLFYRDIEAFQAWRDALCSLSEIENLDDAYKARLSIESLEFQIAKKELELDEKSEFELSSKCLNASTKIPEVVKNQLNELMDLTFSIVKL